MALSDNLVSYYKFNNGALTTDELSFVTLTNQNTVANTASGKSGYGADFGASNTNKALYGANTYGITTGAWSASFWVKFQTQPTSGNSMEFFSKIYNAGSTNYNLTRLHYENQSGTFVLNFQNYYGNNYTPSVTTTLSNGTWYHFVITYDGSTMTLYKDGSSIASGSLTAGTVAGDSNTSKIALGIAHDLSSRPASVYLDELGIWTRALGSSEVTSLYNSGSGSFYPFSFAGTLTATQQSYTLTGQSTTLTHAAKIISAYGSFTLTGQAMLFKIGRKIISAYGSFVLTGQNIAYFLGKVLVADVGSFTLTGQSAILKATLTIVADVSSFVLTGISAGLSYTRKLIASVGSFVLTGVSASLIRDLHITATYGSFVLTGIAIAFKQALSIVASVGTFTLTGFSALLKAKQWFVETFNVGSWSEETKNTDTWDIEDKN